ncbi:MAG: glycosyltransferase [Microgenomates group bacterium]
MDKKTKKLKIGIYNPYFDSLGGGERYVLTLAEHWSTMHDVSIFWDDASILRSATDRFGLDLSKVKTTPNIFGTRFLVRKLIESSKYDLIFFLSDGSVPMTMARQNIIHFQVPFAHIAMTPWKAAHYRSIVVNSEFTKHNLDKKLSVPVTIIYPPVDVTVLKTAKKEKIILSVGRFNALYGAKKQDVLIRAFIEMTKKKQANGWKLVLAGGCLATDEEYANSLLEMAKGYAIEFEMNCSYEKLQSLYEVSSMYWHAAGYGETDPTRMEHFGMTTVEAMSGCCIPIVYNAGGQPEIVKQGINGYLWNTVDELLVATSMIMKGKDIKSIIIAAQQTAKKFSKKLFNEQYDELLRSICK